MEAQGSPLAPLLLPQNGVFAASLPLMILLRSQSHHQTPPKGTEDERRIVSLPRGKKWKNHPDPTSILCFSQGNDTIFQTTLEGSSRLSTKWTISPHFIIPLPHSSKFHPHVLINVPISRSPPMLLPTLCSASKLFPTDPVSNSPPSGSFPHHLIPLSSNCSFTFS